MRSEEDTRLIGFIQGRVDIVVEQSYGSQYKASGWINLEPVFSYQRGASILQKVADLNREKFQQFKYTITLETYNTIMNGEDNYE